MSALKYFLLFVSTLTVIACSPTSSSAPSAPMPTPALILSLSTSPSPPKMGEVEIVLTLQDAQGQALEGAEITVTAEHTDMSGMEMQGNAVEQGQGRYAIRANFSMSGNWSVKVQVRRGELSIQQDFALSVVP